MNKRGFTDRCYATNSKCVASVVVASFLLVAFSGLLGITDMSPVTAIITGAFAEQATFTGFIVWKAKNENMNKHKKYQEDPGESEETQ